MATTGASTGNRAQRRAAPRESSKTETEVPYELKQPDRSGPKGKTLFEIAAERQAELEKEGFYAKHPPPHRDEGDTAQFWSSNDDPIGPFGESLVYTISLAMLHFTLDVMVFHQYRQEIEWREIFAKTGKVIPALFMVIYALHSKAASRWPLMKQIFFLGASVVAGCYLIKSGNNDGYYAVMKRAPPVGSFWVWCVIEMELGFALAHVAAMLVYMFWNGYGAF
ncbi:hypothetical protein EJ08DRAFT_131723 [Tothia fuscella]|uniref:DUF7719 domain-containing protein n=1 Tax=Tothia fuscella TaxID=1048955 RepID=A0A9P4NVJ3_9PEZI|nr:hypothetical protein EJ08DRAFT_131723 [Tothia fuscella]